MSIPYIRHGQGMVRPYLFATNQDLLDLTDILGARILEQHDFGNHCFHTELGIGDSIIVVESSDTAMPDAPRGTTMVYVPDTSAVTEMLTAKGWYVQDAPADAPNGETQATLVDHHGNIWYIATFHPPTS